MFGARCISYHNDRQAPRTLRAAIELFKGFAIVPTQVVRNGSTMVHPVKYLPESKQGYKQTERNGGDYVAWVEVDHLPDSLAPTKATLQFFARAADMLLRVTIEFGTGYIGDCSQLRPVCKEKRNPRTGRIESRHFEPNSVLNGAHDSLLAYSSGDIGPIKNSSKHLHFFVGDIEEGEKGEACSHAVAMLETVADFLEK